jgi:hypothetical protein
MSVFTRRAATLKNASFPLGDAIFMAGTVHLGGIVYLHLGGTTTPTYHDTSTRYKNTFEVHICTHTKYTVVCSFAFLKHTTSDVSTNASEVLVRVQ